MKKLEENSKMSLFEKIMIIFVVSMLTTGFYLQNQEIKNHNKIETHY